MDLFSTEDQPAIDPNKNYLAEYVGEGKKYKTPEDLAKAYYHADTYVPILTRRLDEREKDNLQLKKEFEARAKLEELITQLQTKQNSDTTPYLPPESKVEKAAAPVLDETKLNELVSTRISEWDQTKRQTANVAEVREKLKKALGSNFQEALKAKAEELNVSPSFFNNLAKDHPQVLYKTLGLDQTTQAIDLNVPPTSSRFQPKGVQKRTWSYYQDMKKNQKELYDNPRTALQMQRDAIDLGDEFKDGDFNRDFDRAFYLS